MPESEEEAASRDGALLTAASTGDRDAYRRLVDLYGARVFRFAWRMLSDRTEAEDVTQESFTRLWRALSVNPPDRDALAWLIRTARNLSIDRIRKRKPGGENLLDGLADERPGADALRQSEDVARAVRQAISALPERQRTALLLVHFEGFSQKRAAAAMDVGEAALESLLARARRGLRSRLEAGKDALI